MRSHGEGSVRQREGGQWEARIRLDGAQKSFYGKTRNEALGLARAARADYDRGRATSAGTITVEQHTTDWLARVVKPSVRASTYASYESHCRIHIVPHIGRVRLVDLTPAHVRVLLTSVIESGRSEGTAERVKACLSAALKVAQHDYALPRNVASLTKVPKSDRERFRPEVITAAEAGQVIDAFSESRLGPLVRFAMATGLRQGELLGLSWEDIDLDAGTATVRHSLERSRAQGQSPRLSLPKTEKSRRTLKLNAMAREALADRRRQAAEDQLRAGDTWEGGVYVFANQTGGARNADALTHNFQDHLERHGLPRLRWHALRRIFAASLLDGGVPITHVRDLLGHSELRVTENYAYSMPQALQDAMDVVDQVLSAGSRQVNEGTLRAESKVDQADSA